MSVEGVDYSTARPSPAGLYAAGKRFAVRYGGAGSADKQLTPTEALALTTAGLAVVANVEGTEGGMLGGWSVGATWARNADSHFRRCGMPATRPVYLSCDVNVTAAQWPAVREALRGAASVIGAGRVGLYGGRNAILWAMRDGVARWYWQTYAWSGIPTQWVPGVHIQQYRNGVPVAGGDCDLNRALTVDYGQWTVGQGDDDMFEEADRQAINDIRSTLGSLVQGFPATVPQSNGKTYPILPNVWLKAIVANVDVGPAELAAIEAAAKAGAASAADDIVARVLAGLPEGTLTKETVEQAVRDAFAGGLAPDQDAPTA